MELLKTLAKKLGLWRTSNDYMDIEFIFFRRWWQWILGI